MQDLEHKLKQLMASMLDVPEEELDERASAETLASWDSMKHLYLIVALEDEFDVEFSDEEIGSLTTYSLLLSAVRRLVEAR